MSNLYGERKLFYSIGDIARAAHETVRGYCIGIGDPELLPWDYLSSDLRDSTTSGVCALLSHPTWGPKESHASWVEWKTERGWKYGPKKDVENKLHPDLVPFEELPASQRTKDALFIAVVRGLAGHVKQVIEEVVPLADSGFAEPPVGTEG